jgi:hypothetical protein
MYSLSINNNYTNEKYDYVRYETKIEIFKTMLGKQTLQSYQKEKLEKELELMYDTVIEYLEDIRDELENLYEKENHKYTSDIEDLEEQVYNAEKILTALSNLLDYF